MDSAHQVVFLKRKLALEKLQKDLAAEKEAIAKRHTSQLEVTECHYQWCGIVVEQLVSDVLALIVSHLELVKDMRAFRLTCTHWNQSFCDNAQLFDHHFWSSRHTWISCLVSHPFVNDVVEEFKFRGSSYKAPKHVALFYSSEGQVNHRRFECDEAKYWQMKGGVWMKVNGNEINCVREYGVPLFQSLIFQRANDDDDNQESSGPSLEFSAWKHTGICLNTYDDRPHSNNDRHEIPFPDPCQADLADLFLYVLRKIESAGSFFWYLKKDEMVALDGRMKLIAQSWLVFLCPEDGRCEQPRK